MRRINVNEKPEGKNVQIEERKWKAEEKLLEKKKRRKKTKKQRVALEIKLCLHKRQKNKDKVCVICFGRYQDALLPDGLQLWQFSFVYVPICLCK